MSFAVSDFIKVIKELSSPEDRVAACMIVCKNYRNKPMLHLACAREIIQETPNLLFNHDCLNASLFATTVASCYVDGVTFIEGKKLYSQNLVATKLPYPQAVAKFEKRHCRLFTG
jgi:hypothetical protein